MALGRDYQELSWHFDLRFAIERETAAFGRLPKKGAPLGNLISQLFSNVYLNPLDQFVKRELKEKYYVRYADDFVILSCDKIHLEKLVPMLQYYLLNNLKLELHPNKVQIKKWGQGIDFLGYVVFPHYILLRTKTKRRIIKSLKGKCRSLDNGEAANKTFGQSLQSYIGLLKHCQSYKLKLQIEQIAETRS